MRSSSPLDLSLGGFRAVDYVPDGFRAVDGFRASGDVREVPTRGTSAALTESQSAETLYDSIS